jgi:hypothetical protein
MKKLYAVFEKQEDTPYRVIAFCYSLNDAKILARYHPISKIEKIEQENCWAFSEI